ncbi:hypothetical protein JVU11DRAFT_8303 [Chiua virens]|nr:hypothetical protein JVU11DRAFT_8303 [Chiua virens]
MTEDANMYTCRVDGCGQSFRQEHELKKHNVFHDNPDKLHFCQHPGCDFYTLYKRNLEGHMGKHTGEKRFPCPQEDCTYRTNDASLLIKHRRSYHEYKPRRASPTTTIVHRPYHPSAIPATDDNKATPALSMPRRPGGDPYHNSYSARTAQKSRDSGVPVNAIASPSSSTSISQEGATVPGHAQIAAQKSRDSGFPVNAIASPSFSTPISPEGVTVPEHAQNAAQWTNFYFNHGDAMSIAPSSWGIPADMYSEYPDGGSWNDTISNAFANDYMNWLQARAH